jgi:hypothetical protein
LTSDWPLVGLSAALLLVLLFAASALYGTIAGVAATGNLRAAPYGAALGSHLTFAAFGAKTAVSFGEKNGSNLALQFLPLPWAAVGGLAVGAALRFARARLPDDRRRRIAFGAKLAAAGGVALGIMAGLLDQGSRPGSGYRSTLNGGEVWFYATVLLWFWAWLWLRRDGFRLLPGLPERVRRPMQRIGEGAVTFVAMCGAFGVAGLVFALVVADSNHARIGLLFGFPVVGLSFGAAMADFALGGALGGFGVFFERAAGHTSLARFGLPPGSEAGAAPAWLFVVLLVAPAIVAVTVWRRLERARPAQEQEAVAIGAYTAVGFAGAAWLLAVVSRILVLAAIAPSRSRSGSASLLALLTGQGEGVGTLVAARPNPVSVLFLSLVWALAGGLGAAFVWATRHGARWHIAGAPPPSRAGTPPAGAPPPPPPSAAESAWLLPETPPTGVPPPPPPPPAQEAQAGGDEGSVPGEGEPGEKP